MQFRTPNLPLEKFKVNPPPPRDLSEMVRDADIRRQMDQAQKNQIEPWNLPDDYYDGGPSVGTSTESIFKRKRGLGMPAASDATNQQEDKKQKNITSIETEPELVDLSLPSKDESDVPNQLEDNDQKDTDPIVTEPDPVVTMPPIVPAPERKKADTARLAIDIPRETHKWLKILAITQQRTVSSMVTDVLNTLILESHIKDSIDLI